MADNASDVFVDLSNVAKHELLGFSQYHAALSRWDRLKVVWLQTRCATSHFTLVADESLPRALSRGEQLRLQDLQRQADVVMAVDADIELLQRATSIGGTVLSNDRFVDHSRMPGLHKVTLVGWTVRSQAVLLSPRPLERLRSAVISARARKQQLKQMGFSEGSPELRSRWYCNESACANDLVPIPALQRGAAVCPLCGAYLERGDSWRSPIWLKVMHGQTEVNRFVLEDGEVVYVGRGTDDETVSLADDFDHAGDVLKVGLKHVELSNVDGRLYARDTDTGLGTRMRYPVGARNAVSPPVPLPSNEPKAVDLNWKIILGRTPFTVQISGS